MKNVVVSVILEIHSVLDSFDIHQEAYSVKVKNVKLGYTITGKYSQCNIFFVI